MAEMVRLKDIAETLGVSVVTVSNALAGRKGVSAPLRARILACADQAGLDPEKYGKEETHSMSAGVLISERYISVGTSFYWEMYQQAALAVSRRNGFTLLQILKREEEGSDPAETVPMLSGGEADGLIVIGKIREPFLQRLMSIIRVPVVLMDFCKSCYACDAVLSSNYYGMYRAAHRLIEEGHTKIGFVGTPEISENIRERQFGYRRAMMEAGLPVRAEWQLTDREPSEETPALVLPDEMPTAFACSSDYAAGILHRKLEEAGLRVPEDVSVIGYDDYLYGDPFAEHLTSFHVDMKQMGEKAAALLSARVNGESGPPRVCYIDSTITERDSCRTEGRAAGTARNKRHMAASTQ